ncbi:methyltransferase [Actinoplanes philippinensis]|uniref:Methyltransferase domain-containing protein n=1 Tax=Actinoplanes philippinensis TaxID=35752 RepID=A0A1I2LW11_9ACTN|nr:class I SAM-dependent methyltransferase [Actinoplanes philippinensis]GIE82248.1 methyltransferase [Actinoplanes philippinensis]SFF82798.1 Methyltransferase domain-containing protein [Actinoplanes philippinensis]
MELLDDRALHASSVVANNAMNRERQLHGVNSYAKVLGFDPLTRAGTAWLDLCCGSGRALIQAAGHTEDVTLVGVDLVDAFRPAPPGVTLIAAPLETWSPSRAFDLITCVHGLPYVGDKLGVLRRVLTWLTPAGTFVADLDLASIQPGGRRLAALLRAAGVDYDSRRKRLTCTGPRALDLPYRYRGADDRAGPNYTGQPAVTSYYEKTV